MTLRCRAALATAVVFILALSIVLFLKASCEAIELADSLVCEKIDILKCGMGSGDGRSCNRILFDACGDTIFLSPIILYLEKQVNSPPARIV